MFQLSLSQVYAALPLPCIFYLSTSTKLLRDVWFWATSTLHVVCLLSFHSLEQLHCKEFRMQE